MSGFRRVGRRVHGSVRRVDVRRPRTDGFYGSHVVVVRMEQDRRQSDDARFESGIRAEGADIGMPSAFKSEPRGEHVAAGRIRPEEIRYRQLL